MRLEITRKSKQVTLTLNGAETPMWETMIGVHVGDADMWICGHGKTEAEADARAESSLAEAVQTCDQVRETFRRTGVLNWDGLGRIGASP